MSVVIHEVSHGYAAYIQGDPTAKLAGRLTLNPISHIDPIGSIVVPIITSLGGFPFGWAKPVPFNPYNLKNQRWGELFVAIAGPLSNIFIALVFSLIVRFATTFLPASFIGLSVIIVIVNLSLALFNLVPVPPLDGSKVLFSILPFRYQKIRFYLERYAILLVFILILVPAFSTALGTAVLYVTTKFTGLPLDVLLHYLS